MLVPNQLTGKNNCTRPLGMYVTIAPNLQPCFLRCTLSAYMSVTVSYYQNLCILHLYLTISHVCNNCIRPFATSIKVAPNQQSISNHMCCLLHLLQDQYRRNGCYNYTGPAGLYCTLHPTSSQDGNEQLQHADILLRDCILC